MINARINLEKYFALIVEGLIHVKKNLNSVCFSADLRIVNKKAIWLIAFFVKN
jgi:hypothetical protein